ncbi:putative dinucleotide-binding enzyme [Neisseria perflava]|uniref:NADPH-dependent F420 reductase n=1 Tax=Neisseria perflava TaxID=33053 RepID=UPI00209DBF99|nr:NAD(P)-binding domain-containing protein [Neisseria perflava]MCP1773266.1 putative dinucleotide-binding enzyme [Neisseria perflava]
MAFTRRNLIKTLMAGAALAALPACGQTQSGANTGIQSSSAPSAQQGGKPRLAVVGGWQATTIGSRWVNSDYEVMFASRDLDNVRRRMQQYGVADNPLAHAGSVEEATKFGDIVLFAVPYESLAQINRDFGANLRGKIVIDSSNPSGGSEMERRGFALGSIGLLTAQLLPNTRLVRAFSSVDATQIEASSERSNNKLGVPLASDDQAALQQVAALVTAAGCEPVITGNLASSAKFQRGSAAFRNHKTAAEIRRVMNLH